jgi:hypothetical protein
LGNIHIVCLKRDADVDADFFCLIGDHGRRHFNGEIPDSHRSQDKLSGVSDLCTLASDGWSYAIDIDEYTQIAASNCTTFSNAGTFLRLDGILAVVDTDGFNAIKNLAWIDVINSAVWLLVVVILEIDVWLQERNRLEGTALRISNSLKVVFYGSLLFTATFWGIKGDFVDFWDAFLWLVAFVFIELNVFEWRQEDNESEAESQITG